MILTRESVHDSVNIRPAQVADIDRCGRICYDAFDAVCRHHGFQSDFKTAGSARRAIAAMFAHPLCYCLVAEERGAVVGSNCMDERSSIYGIGPLTIDPSVQNAGIGRLLMAAMLNRATQRGTSGVRLLQAAFHCRSMALYSKLSFIVRECLFVMDGALAPQTPESYTVRSGRAEDLESCNALCRRVHGHDRAGELTDAIARGTVRVAEIAGRISAYSTDVGFYGHSIAEDNESLQALIIGVGKIRGPGIIVPSRNNAFLRWCLDQGLRIVQPMTLMTMGFYSEPAGAYLPSILF